MKRWIMAATLVMLMACQSSVVHRADTQQQKDNYEQQIDKVVYIDHNLNRVEIGSMIPTSRSVVKVTTERFGSTQLAMGNLQAYAVIKNRTDYDLQLEVRVQFLDWEAIPLDDVTAWTRLYLPANGVGTFRESSLSQEAKHFMIEIREGR